MKESEIVKNIDNKLGIAELNPMQVAMSGKVNVPKIILLSPTGSGKTVAYLLPLLKNLKPSTGRVQAVILAPSRELALQISKVAQLLATNYKVTCCYGGHNFEDETNSLSITPDIIVSTPGRLLDHIKRNNVYLQPVRLLVLDEFDKSLELGFHEEMKKIINRMPNLSRQILTSATQIDAFPEFIDIKGAETVNFLYTSTIQERLKVYNVQSDIKDKLEALLLLLSNLEKGKVIVFVNHRDAALRIFDFLKKHKFPVGIYHGGLEQMDREKAITMLNNGTFSILVTTDLGSRGLDIEGIKHIIHYHLPNKVETYTHRNGRTARIDNNGAVYVITGPEEKLPDFVKCDDVFELDPNAKMSITKDTETLYFSAGKKEKISRKDILGFLISKAGIDAKMVGKIDIADHYALVAVPSKSVKDILNKICKEKIKNQKVKIAIARQ